MLTRYGPWLSQVWQDSVPLGGPSPPLVSIWTPPIVSRGLVQEGKLLRGATSYAGIVTRRGPGIDSPGSVFSPDLAFE